MPSALEQLADATCLAPEIVDGGPLFRVRGFPGLFFFAAAGHTPGSQVFIAHVRGSDGVRTYALTGDVVNQIDGVRRNIPKPLAILLWLHRSGKVSDKDLHDAVK